jgi:hypothetical protein
MTAYRHKMGVPSVLKRAVRGAAFCSDQRGATLIAFALAIPVLLTGISGALEYSSIVDRRAQLQAAADAGALVGAKELTLAGTDANVIAIAQEAAQTKLALNSTKTPPEPRARVINNRTSVEVTIEESIPFLMGHYLGQPTAHIGVRAVARLAGGTRKLCVLALEPTGDSALRLDHSAKLSATGCDVQSNSTSAEGIKAFSSSVLKSERTCSSGGYKSFVSSNFTPTPITDCPPINDPLASRTPPSVGGCIATNKVIDGSITPTPPPLQPGRYCGGLTVTNGAVLTLNPGEYVMDNKLVVNKGATLAGENVGFYFLGGSSVIDFDADSIISLTAPKTGPLAGILFFEDRGAPLSRKFRILSNNARKLLGTIYLPRGILYVGASQPVADESAYTVVVARQLQLEAGPDLVLNTNYGATDIPVPEGVGPVNNANVSLAQ